MIQGQTKGVKRVISGGSGGRAPSLKLLFMLGGSASPNFCINLAFQSTLILLPMFAWYC